MQLKQNTPEWLEFRKSHIGASDAPVIMQVSPFKTPLQLYEDKLDLVPKQQMNAAMQRGHDLEPEALKAFEAETGILMMPRIVVSKKIPYMMASVDGMSLDDSAIVEIKCPGAADHITALAGMVPEHYYPQLQHQMFVCDLDEAYYFSYRPDSHKLITVPRDNDYIEKMLLAEAEFYKCLQTKTPPKITDKDYVSMHGEEWANLCDEYKSLQNLEERKEKVKARLLELSGHRNAKGCGVKISKYMQKGRVDYSAIPALKDLDLETFRKPEIECFKVSVDDKVVAF